MVAGLPTEDGGVSDRTVTCGACGEPAAIKPRAVASHREGRPTITIINVPTIVCHECGTDSYSEQVGIALDHLRKEVDRPHTVTATVDYAKAAEAW